MRSHFDYPTSYFLQEGKENLAHCLEATFAAALAHRVSKIVIFTSAGNGVLMALDQYRSQEQYSHIELVAVTFPNQSEFTKGDPSEHRIPESSLRIFAENRVPVVRAHLPFDPIRTHYTGHGVLGQDFGLIGNALRIFGGSMSLCVQAVLMASDAGHAALGEHVIAMTSDTSILVRAASTSRFLTDLIVREIICKPVLLTIGKAEKAQSIIEGETDIQLELEPPE
ncbi:MAG TPA: hypothetical protein VND90_09590 [Terracidiphilus sp.]|nr:hypothetical protein [Terracidiphilus sp.]